MTSLDLTLSEFSSFSFCAAALGFCAIFLYITRNMLYVGDQRTEWAFPTSVQRGSPKVPQMNMVRIEIPFTFKLLRAQSASYEELQFSLLSEVHYEVHCFWGVSVKQFHLFLCRPWYDIRDAFARGDFLNGYYEQSGLQAVNDANTEETYTVSLNKTSSDFLKSGTLPRNYYPLVVIVIRNVRDQNVLSNETVALINIIHIKDSICTLPTRILAQYLKQANGQLSSLKQLYLSTESLNYETANQKDREAEQQYCIVCQYFPLSRAILPCRHTCVCANCFSRLDRCPICRGSIKSYFCIRDEHYITDCSSSKQIQSRWSLLDWLHTWDDRLTDFLGFQR
ncbi:cell growth regulator with RING finger domain protein 1-like [Cylas formicarius]|uniref:cell growth regulator with RING finger domain protein 1-like n=1 Tax=Cylas formicarius TaxID=197179 RepID=UPI002958B194|nr:cell growth regulator with RING finger domain protein 1-like [Cylas formicarius]